MSFVILTTPECVWCEKAKNLISSHGYKYVEFDVTTHKPLREFMSANLLMTVPQVYMLGEYVGGYNQLVPFLEEERRGKLTV